VTTADLSPPSPDPRDLRLPLTYGECRARFRRAAGDVGAEVTAHAIDATGPDGERLTIDVVALGSPRPARALVVLSGVHGVEGFIGSAVQCDLLRTLDPSSLPDDVGILVVHAVNPWGMAHGRRQNESNVDLNRNWRRDASTPVHNDAYDLIHPLACPDTPDLPTVDVLFAAAGALVAERGLVWVRDGITTGQYRHPDGLHFGGERSEASTLVLEQIVAEHLADARRVLTLDLHTGHGPRGEITLLSDQAPGTPQDRFLRAGFPGVRVEATADNPEATTGVKSGQIANGVAQVLPDAICLGTCAEFGTAGDDEQLVATYQEQWVHRRGRREDPAYAEVVRAYRRCFTPDDPAWEDQVLPAGRDLALAAVDAVTAWTD
jgi:predicted deacylase